MSTEIINFINREVKEKTFDEATIIGSWDKLGLWDGHIEPISYQIWQEIALKLKQQVRYSD